MVEGAHSSHNLLCCFRTASSALNPAFEPQIPNSPAPTSHFIPRSVPPSPHQPISDQANMPRLCHKMRCRRGSSRGRAIRPPSLSLFDSTPSDSSSPSTTAHSEGRYPATRSGRGRVRHAQIAGSRRAEEAPRLPTASVLMLQPNHSTQFQFRCTMERPCVIATISIAFKEEPQSSDISVCNTSGRKTHGSSSRTRKTHDEAQDWTSATQGHNIPGGYTNMEAMTRDQ